MTRRLSADEAAAVAARAVPIPSGAAARAIGPEALCGTDPTGSPMVVALGRPTVLVFVKQDCDGCIELAQLVRDGIEGFEVVGVLRELPGPDAAIGHRRDDGTWLVGPGAFDVMAVTSAPFFVVLDEARRVVVEGVALGRDHLVAHCARAAAGESRPDVVRLPGTAS